MSGPLGSSQWFKPKPFYSHSIDQSLRFEDADTAYLYDPSSGRSAGNRRTWTFSAWVKVTNLGSGTQNYILGATTDNYVADWSIFFFGSDELTFYGYTTSPSPTAERYQLHTKGVFRDPSAWYHIVLAWDTTQSTEADRIILYVNGSRVTDLDTYNRPDLNYEEAFINNTAQQDIGRAATAAYGFDGYMAEVNFIDGQALGPTSFGETKAGIWIPKDTSGLTFGSNGYRLQFQDSSALGDDTSGNTGNDFTSSGLAATDVVLDSPTNNFCVLNPLFTNGGTAQSLSEGNLEFTSDSNYALANGTFAMRSGKWYWETLIKTWVSVPIVGITQGTNTAGNSYVGYDPNGNVKGFGYDSGGFIYGATGDGTAAGAALASGQTTYTTGDIIGCSFDADAGELKFYKNNSLIYTVSSINEHDWMPANSGYNSGVNIVNFGQDSSFANNKTSGSAAASDDNGVGDFYYSPPSGFLALCSANLPDPAIDPAEDEESSDHFNTVLYTGTGTTDQSVTGVGFQPDWNWIKSRSDSYAHWLSDSVRGAGKALRTGSTTASDLEEYTTLPIFLSFDSDGFTVDVDTATANGTTNGSSSTFVAWNWLAGGTTPTTQTYKVVVDNDGANKYRFRNNADSATFATYAPTIELQEGGTYVFDWSDDGTNGVVSAQGHPIRFSTTSNGTHGGGTEYTTGVVKDDSAYTTTITVAAGAPTLYYYCQYHSGMGGQVNTDNHGSSNFEGDVQSKVSANTKSGFSVVSWTQRSSSFNDNQVGHGLSQAPELVIGKTRTQSSGAWGWHVFAEPKGVSNYLFLNNTTAATPSSNIWNPVNTTVFNASRFLMEASSPAIAYCFHGVDGYSKIGSYIGNGYANGPFIYTGFRPAWVMIKRTNLADNWYIFDNKRSGFNFDNDALSPNLTLDEFDGISYDFIDLLSNGFKMRDTYAGRNTAGGEDIYLAFAEQPFKYANAR